MHSFRTNAVRRTK